MLMIIDIEKYIEKYQDRFFPGEVERIRENHKRFYSEVEWIDEREMPNESVCLFEGREVGYNVVVRGCMCTECECVNVAECEHKAHWCGECRATCQ
ncbi:MAG: hypothetical protein Tp172MES00d2C118482111_48 [Prokaryotic dsDNA virus sp.]|nr:MAG: hypothetical protein Tp172MES00d2C118482111_48 [Prokaryotic dsDNA virus sp.]